MKTKYLLLGGLLLVSPFFASAAVSDHVVISQVQVSGNGGANDEFVELHNPTEAAVDLSGWSIQYKSSTGALPLTSGKKNLPAVSLPAGGYYLIVNNSYNGSVSADLAHASFSLSGSASGATVFLSNSSSFLSSCSDSSIVDRLAYGTGSGNCPEGAAAPLPASDQSLTRTAETDNNASDFSVVSSNPRNLASSGTTPSEVPADDAKKPEPRKYTNSLMISEFLVNPEGADTGEEWVELFNPSNEIVEMDGWKLDDRALSEDKVGVTAYAFPKGLRIPPNTYFSVDLPEDVFGLSNFGGDELRLIWPDDTVAARVKYEMDVPEEQSYARKPDGSYAWTIKPTKNQENVIDDGKPINPQVLGAATPNGDVFVRISEVLPNPEGTDSGREWVKLMNTGADKADLKGWFMDDGQGDEKIKSSALLVPEQVLHPGQEIAVTLPAGKFALNNSGLEHLRLFNAKKIVIDQVTYNGAKEGEILSLSKGKLTWTKPVEALPEEAVQETIGLVESAEVRDGGAVTGTAVGMKQLPRTGQNFGLYIRIFVIFGSVWYILRVGQRLTKEAHTDPR